MKGMKKVLVMMMLLVGGSTLMNAQERSAEDWEKIKVERVKKQAERKADELKLDGNAKADFIVVYSQYQNDLFSSARKAGFNNERGERNGAEKKELTEAEAKEKIEKYFARQEKQIEMMKTRLAVQKKYYAEFAKTLTPQQLAKVFEEPNFQMMNGRGRQGRPGGFGPGMRMGEGPQN